MEFRAMEFRAVKANGLSGGCGCRNCASTAPRPGEAPGPPDLGAAIRGQRKSELSPAEAAHVRTIEKWIQPDKENNRG